MALTSPGVIKATNDVLVQLKPELTMVKAFSYDVSDAVANHGDKIRVAMVSGGTAENYGDENNAETNTGNYEHATGSLSDCFVTLNRQPKSTIPITAKEKLELPNDSFWTKAAEAGRDTIGKAISDAVCGLFTAANCQAGKITMASVTKNAVAKLRTNAATKGRVGDYVLLLSGDYFADLISLLDSNVFGGTDPIQSGAVDRLYGFRSVLCANDLPEGIKGALVPASGVAVAVRPVAIPDPEAYPECGIVTDENGFSLTAMRHTSFQTAKAFFNVTALVGADILRKTDAFYIAAS